MAGFTLNIIGGPRLIAKLAQLGQGGLLTAKLREKLSTLVQDIREYVVLKKLQGQVLEHHTGVLGNAIDWKVDIEPGRVWAKVFVGKQAWYGKIHEYGGTYDVPEHLRLVTEAFGKPIKPRWVAVKDHTATFPVRSFMRSSLKEWRSRSIGQIRRAVQETLKAA